MKTLLTAVLILIAVMSIITLILYASDKKKAQKKQWRISEKTLLLCGLFGGAAGGLLGMKLCRHKTKHWYFWAVNIVSLALHIAAVVMILLKQ